MSGGVALGGKGRRVAAAAPPSQVGRFAIVALKMSLNRLDTGLTSLTSAYIDLIPCARASY